jgi:hypothetical protein
MATCECGCEIKRKNAAGHYRDSCWQCIKQAADRERHVDVCQRNDCAVCATHPGND